MFMSRCISVFKSLSLGGKVQVVLGLISISVIICLPFIPLFQGSAPTPKPSVGVVEKVESGKGEDRAIMEVTQGQKDLATKAAVAFATWDSNETLEERSRRLTPFFSNPSQVGREKVVWEEYRKLYPTIKVECQPTGSSVAEVFGAESDENFTISVELLCVVSSPHDPFEFSKISHFSSWRTFLPKKKPVKQASGIAQPVIEYGG